jgi:hypothetical protein
VRPMMNSESLQCVPGQVWPRLPKKSEQIAHPGPKRVPISAVRSLETTLGVKKAAETGKVVRLS